MSADDEKIKFTWRTDKSLLVEMKIEALKMGKNLNEVLDTLCLEFLKKK